MIHKTCPICGGKLSELCPAKGQRNVEHKVYICDEDVDHKYWVSEYESDCLRWNPAANFEDVLYFRKFKATNREVIRDLELKKLIDMVSTEEYKIQMRDCEDDTEFHGRNRIQRQYENTPDYEEILDAKVHENLLGIIQSQNDTIKELISEYQKLENYSNGLQAKLDEQNSAKVTPSGIILKA